MNEKEQRVALLGSGSWATAVAKILMENVGQINWFIRDDDTIEQFRQYRHNPGYMRGVIFDINRIRFSSDINQVVRDSDILVVVIPSAYLLDYISGLTEDISNKLIISGIKGLVPDNHMVIAEYFHTRFLVPYESIGIIAGPSHAEEVALERLSYLTLACQSEENASLFARLFSCSYIRTNISDDIWGTEYSSVIKNIIAIAAGIVHGLMYGDNFQAVLVSNAILEIERFVNAVHPITRDIKSSAYLGDLLVTSYSQFSRNRTFGNMIGKGYSVRTAQLEMHMVAEGYYAAKSIRDINARYNVDMPICEAVYQILYNNRSPRKEIQKLTEKLS
ncbi:glycerol-3-phosphate dehydrogenase [Bacteroidales bacterium 6E]|nr:glycerol-3-phosphate dehydrogenase [Bacteroidales bacterium 6E]